MLRKVRRKVFVNGKLIALMLLLLFNLFKVRMYLYISEGKKCYFLGQFCTYLLSNFTCSVA